MATLLVYENTSSTLSTFSPKNTLATDVLNHIEPSEVFRNISVVKTLNKAKFQVYLVNSKVNKQDYAMKVFAFIGNKQHIYFQNEIRFANLSHPNIIKTHYVQQVRETISCGTIKKVSYTIMEYAPNGDLFDFVMNYSQGIDDKMIRTYFRQMIDGLEYLHNNGVSHMDLKLENLLLGKDFTLKIADFDLSHFVTDTRILSSGTKFYRPPEVIHGTCRNTKAADIYSAGVVLFCLKTHGMLPHTEENYVGGVDFARLLYIDNKEFWKKHSEIQLKYTSFFDDDFKNLFNSMIRLNTDERATIYQIKHSNWYNDAVYTSEELKTLVGKLFDHSFSISSMLNLTS